MKNIKYLIFIGCLTSCLQSNVEQVRIVDSNGNPAKINKIVPKFNEEQLMKQREAFSSVDKRVDVNKFREDYNNIQQPSDNNNSLPSDQNIIVPVENKYPNDLFADRITNYNYIQDNKIIQDNKVIKNTKHKNEIIEDSSAEIITGDIINTETYNNKKYQKKTTLKENNISQKYLIENERGGVNNIKKNTTTAKPRSNQEPAYNSKNKSEYYIQIGVYSERKNADLAYQKYTKISKATLEEYNTNNKKKYKVLLGPYYDRKTAEKNLEKVIKTGHYDVYITEKK